MADPVTIADIYALFQTSQAEADRRAAEADRRLVALNADADRRAADADRRAAEAEQRLQRLERVAANTSREVAGLTTRWGQFVENLVAPAVIRLFQERGIEVQEISRRMQSKRPGAEMEIDIFAVDGDVAVAIEVKSRLGRQDVDDFLARLGRFRQAFPHYPGYRIYGAVAGIEVDEGVDRYAYQQGLFVIKQTGDTVALANDRAFQPAAW
ncbi:MAG: hypothetical protein EA368_00515 [Leptolyngbya sp. DLM2.Bin27]|nr:MAG: hypothetical protein EA368_00515 [Leptolyngbya sp. DLM2.Bin27]